MLDDLLNGSRPQQADLSDDLRSLAHELATDVTQTVARKRPRSRLAITGLVLAGALTLGAGAAVAVPLIYPWWLWVPAEDLTISTGTFDRDGAPVECDITMRVLTDGQTALADSDRRLWEARRFLESVRSEDYAAAAATLVESGQTDKFQQPYTYDAALVAVITDDFKQRDLLGRGVSLETIVDCEAM